LTVQPGLPSGGQSGDISTSNTGKQTATPQAKNNIFRDAMHFEDGWFDGADLYILPDRYDGSDLDIFASALSAAQVHRAASMPAPNESLVNLFAIKAAFLNEINGDLAAANKYSKMITDDPFRYNHSDAYFMCMAFEAAGQIRESNLLHKASPWTPPKRTPEDKLRFPEDTRAEDQLKHLYPLTTHCLDAVANGNLTSAEKYSGQLISYYADELPYTRQGGWMQLKRQNLFCTLLNIARKFSDRKWLSQSTDIIDKTLAIAEKKGEVEGKGLAIAELAVNKERQRQSDSDLWHRLLQECEWVPRDAAVPDKAGPNNKEEKKFEWSTSEKLRRLASAYYQVGDYSRAQVFLEQALKTLKSKESQSSAGTIIAHCRGTGVGGDKALLLLQAACLRAKQGKFDQAREFADQALSGPAPEEYGYGAKLVDLAQMYCQHGDIKGGVDLLRRARDKNIPVYRAPSSFHTSRYLVEYWLANLLCCQGNFKEASSIINGAILGETHSDEASASGAKTTITRIDENDYPSSVLAGDCAYAMHDYATAALRYKEAGLTENIRGLPNAFQPVLREFWLRKAVNTIDLAKAPSGADSAQIYFELAKILPDSSSAEAYSLCLKALALMPNSAAERTKILEEAARRATSAGNLPELSKNLKAAATNANNLVGPGAVSGALNDSGGASSTNSGAAAEDPSARQVSLLRQAAEIAERNKSEEACSKYMALVGAEANCGKLDQAIADCRHGIQLYNADSSRYFYGMRSHHSCPEQILIGKLMSENRQSEAENLMVEAADIAVASCGSGSQQAAWQRSALLEFYIQHKNTEKALSALDSLVSGDLRIYSPRSYVSFHSVYPSLKIAYDWALKTIEEKDSTLSLKILNKILEAQKKQLEKDNLQFVETYNDIARDEEMVGNDPAALDAYGKAFSISKLYYGDLRGARGASWAYIQLLKKTGDIKQAAQLEAAYNAGNTALTPFQQQEREAREKRLDSDINFLQSEYEKSKADAPYSEQTRSLLFRLIRNARKEKNWSFARAAAEDGLKINVLFSPEGQVTSNLQGQLAEMCLEQGDLDGAKDWFNKIIANPDFDARNWENKPCQLVKAYVDAGRISDACSYMQFLLDGKKVQAPYLVDLLTERCWVLMGAGRKEQAKQLIHALFEKSAVWIPTVNQFHTAVDLADCAIDVGEAEQIPTLLDRAEVLLGVDDGNLFLPEVSRLWRKIGNEKKAGSVDSKYLSYVAKIGGKADLLFCAAEPYKDAVSRIQTGRGANFNASKTKANYSFGFAAIASNSLILEDKARICQRKGGPTAFAGTFGELQCGQPANHSGEISFVSSGEPDPGMVLPPVPTLPFTPIIDPPNLLSTNPLTRMAGADKTFKGLGDFRITSADLGSLAVDSSSKGLLRIFLLGDEGQKRVFHLQSGGRGNARIPGGRAPHSSSVEIWYAGYGTIKLDCDSTFNGIIYAPNARVEIGPGHATFAGSIVAKDIVATGESRIFANPEYANWKSDQ